VKNVSSKPVNNRKSEGSVGVQWRICGSHTHICFLWRR